MRAASALFVVAVLSAMPISVIARQDPGGSMHMRGGMVMGFDQELTAHHFLLFTDGGAIDVSVKDPADIKDRNAIRSHLPHVAGMFGEGDFEAPMLVHDSKNVPGTR